MAASLRVCSDLNALADAAVEEIVRSATQAIHSTGRFSIALSGGKTPQSAYTGLAERREVDWTRVHLYWGDERHVPHNSPQSNYRMAKAALIDRVPLPHENVHPVPFMDPAESARRYEEQLRRDFHHADGELPRLDLILLGMGPDGHVASLFPGTAALQSTDRLVVENWVAALDAWRITMTLPVINNAANVIVLVSGQEKAGSLQRVLQGPHTPPLLPAERVQPADGRLLWLVTRDAAPAGTA